jgi:hypothetical protein
MTQSHTAHQDPAAQGHSPLRTRPFLMPALALLGVGIFLIVLPFTDLLHADALWLRHYGPILGLGLAMIAGFVARVRGAAGQYDMEKSWQTRAKEALLHRGSV